MSPKVSAKTAKEEVEISALSKQESSKGAEEAKETLIENLKSKD